MLVMHLSYLMICRQPGLEFIKQNKTMVKKIPTGYFFFKALPFDTKENLPVTNWRQTSNPMHAGKGSSLLQP